MKAAALLLLPISLFAQDGFEAPPTLSAAAILKPEFAAGDGFTVRDPVATYGGRNEYMIDSNAGIFEASGNAMLVRRVREIAAISRLRAVSGTEEYAKALGAAVASPLLLTKGLIENPVGTVTGVPKGLWKFMGRARQDVQERADGREHTEYEDSDARQLIGFSKTKRDMALKLGVDPYSTNETLQRELNRISWAAYAGKMTFTLATVPVSGGAGLALTLTGVTDTFEQALRDQSPADLRLANSKRLVAMGCSRTATDAFLNNPAFSPSTQTALVLHLDALQGVANRASFLQLAAGQCTNESDALFFCETSRLFAQLQTGGSALARLEAFGSLPVGLGTEGNAYVALEWDYAAWTEHAAAFITRLKSAQFQGKTPTNVVVALSGVASPMVQQKLDDAGIVLVARLAPGPLQ